MGSLFREVEFIDSVDSTNDYIRRYIVTGVGRAVWAAEQTSGKGTYGREWFSPRGQGLYASYLFFPDWEPHRAVALNQVATLAVVESIRSLPGTQGLSLSIKLPNDVLIAGRKVAGILVELSSLPDSIHWAILGIGVNLLQREFPGGQNFRLTPTSLLNEGAGPVQPGRFFELLTKNLERLLGGDEERFQHLETSFQESVRDDPNV